MIIIRYCRKYQFRVKSWCPWDVSKSEKAVIHSRLAYLATHRAGVTSSTEVLAPYAYVIFNFPPKCNMKIFSVISKNRWRCTCYRMTSIFKDPRICRAFRWKWKNMNLDVLKQFNNDMNPFLFNNIWKYFNNKNII